MYQAPHQRHKHLRWVRPGLCAEHLDYIQGAGGVAGVVVHVAVGTPHALKNDPQVLYLVGRKNMFTVDFYRHILDASWADMEWQEDCFLGCITNWPAQGQSGLHHWPGQGGRLRGSLRRGQQLWKPPRRPASVPTRKGGSLLRSGGGRQLTGQLPFDLHWAETGASLDQESESVHWAGHRLVPDADGGAWVFS